jgi:dynamin 1-like protein
MTHLSKNNESDYIIFDDEKDKKYCNFNEVKEKIQKMINDINGKYTDKPIKFTIFSYYCVEMNMIDLPGITNISNIFLFVLILM